MENEFDNIFIRLKEMLQKYAGAFTVKPDLNDKYGLYAKVGPATLKLWGGKMKKPVMPVAWIEVGKAYVSYHLMGLYYNDPLVKTISKDLKARMQGKTCFNFKKTDEKLFEELDDLTGRSIADFKKGGWVE